MAEITNMPVPNIAIPGRPHIVFGKGVRAALGTLVSQLAAPARIGLVTTSGSLKVVGVEAEIISLLETAGELTGLWRVTSHPPVTDCFRIAEEVARTRPNVVVALGGGSAMDTGKLAGAWSDFATGSEALSFDGVSVAGNRVRTLVHVVAIPTTAGSGSEVTETATAWLEKSKSSFKGPALLPDLAIVDPELCGSLSRRQMIACGMDALSHAVDSICSRRTTPATLSLAKASVTNLTTSLLRICENAEGTTDLSSQSLGSLLAGLVISQTGTTLIHSLSYTLTIEYKLEHGLACGVVADTLLNGGSSLSLELHNRLSSLLGTVLADNVRRAYRRGVASLMGDVTLLDYFTENNVDNFISVAEKSGRLQQFYREINGSSLREICLSWPTR